MWIKSIAFTEFKGRKKEWVLEPSEYGQINLIVGVNAAGKSRSLAIINSLALMFLNQRKIIHSNFQMVFSDDKKILKYEYDSKEKIINEKLTIDAIVKFKRNKLGEGYIKAIEHGGSIKFKIKDDESVINGKRDSIQHPFLENLIDWGMGLRFFQFGTDLSRQNLLIKSAQLDEALEKKNSMVTIETCYLGLKNPAYKELIIQDMKAIGYDIEDIGIGFPENVQFETNVPIEKAAVQAIYVKESDLKDKTTQFEMSSGMYRSLSIIIALNYYILTKLPSCILIDDIGEGLDYNRAKSLINLVIKRIKDTSVQLIMTTNDRFVMNSVPLEYWMIINRVGNKCYVINYKNSKKVFDEFEYLGLNNFDFFSSKLFLGDNKNE